MKKIKDIINEYVSAKLAPGDNIIYESIIFNPTKYDKEDDLKYIAADSEVFKKVPVVLISQSTDEINYLSERKRINEEQHNLIDYNMSIASYYSFYYGNDNYFRKNCLTENLRIFKRPVLNPINPNPYFNVVDFFSERFNQISNNSSSDCVRLGPTITQVSVRDLKKVFITDKFQRTYIMKKNNKFIMNIFLLF